MIEYQISATVLAKQIYDANKPELSVKYRRLRQLRKHVIFGDMFNVPETDLELNSAFKNLWVDYYYDRGSLHTPSNWVGRNWNYQNALYIEHNNTAHIVCAKTLEEFHALDINAEIEYLLDLNNLTGHGSPTMLKGKIIQTLVPSIYADSYKTDDGTYLFINHRHPNPCIRELAKEAFEISNSTRPLMGLDTIEIY